MNPICLLEFIFILSLLNLGEEGLDCKYSKELWSSIQKKVKFLTGNTSALSDVRNLGVLEAQLTLLT